MTARGKTKPPRGPKVAKPKPDPNTMEIVARDGKSREVLMAEAVLQPLPRAVIMAKHLGSTVFGGKDAAPAMNDAMIVAGELSKAARGGDLGSQSDMLVGHAMLLDSVFTELVRRSTSNIESGYLTAGETYLRMALKAQTQARMAIETLTKMHQPREQTVRHVHVYEGGQAVIAENVHTGGRGNGKSDDQSHAIRAAALSSALPGEDPFRNGVPIPSSEGPEALQDARRDESRSSEG